MKFFTLSFNANQNRSAIYLLHQHVCNQLADKLGGSSVCIFGYLVCLSVYTVCISVYLDQNLLCVSVYTVCISVYPDQILVCLYIWCVYLVHHHVCNQLVDKLGGTTGRKQ